jgi:hypothetical protein
VGEEPEEQAQTDTEEQAGDDREIEGGVLAAVDDVAGETAETKGKFTAEVEKPTDEDKKATEEKENAAEFAKRIHNGILPEAAAMSFLKRYLYSYRVHTIDKY